MDEMEEIIGEFITEAEEALDRVDPLFVELEQKGYDRDLLNDIFRSVHTLKGAAGFLGFQKIVDVAHGAESILKKLRDGEIGLKTSHIDIILESVDMLRLLISHIKNKDGVEEETSDLVGRLNSALNSEGIEEKAQDITSMNSLIEEGAKVPEKADAPKQESITGALTAEKTLPDKKEAIQTLRIDVDRVDKVMNLTGEIVLIRNRLLNIATSLDSRYPGDESVENLLESVSFLDLVTSDMQLAVMRMRMQPLKKVFSKFPRLVRDIASAIGKEVELNITGEDTEVDRSVIEYIGDPMVHIIRNAIDHGIEPVEERIRKNKDRRGKINIDAYQKGNQIIIEISDDGRGIDVEKVKKKALEKSLITAEEFNRLSDEAALNLIFLPGFSTAEVATELSGRGVGMDVVKTNISRLNGYVEVTTKKDLGSIFRISLPLTLAIIQSLMVKASGIIYAVPLAPVEETLVINSKDVKEIAGQKVTIVRERVYPLFELSEILTDAANGHKKERRILVISSGDRKFCLAVDELIGQEEVVIKAIDGKYTDSTYVLGATITGDGKVVLIIDPSGISRNIFKTVKV
ncbi:MAG: chemotaxis protein CheA [Thermodesulfovibrionales bacterium]